MRRTTLVVVLLLIISGCEDDATRVSAPEPTESSTEAAQQGTIVIQRRPEVGIRYIVGMREGHPRVTREEARGLAEPHGGTVGHVFKYALNGFRITLPNEQAAEALKRNPNVEYVEASGTDQLQAAGTQFSPGWGLDVMDERANIKDNSYLYYESGSGVHIFILDTGIHGNLASLLPNLSSNYVGSWAGPYNPFVDCHGHGTWAASLAASQQWGAAKDATLHAMQVADCGGSANRGDVAEAVDNVIDWALNHGQWPAVINYSFGSESDIWPKPHEDAMRSAVANGIPVVVSAGNNGLKACDNTPARVSELITVAAIDANFQRAVFNASEESSWGTCVDIFAPGKSIPSADISPPYETTFSGTSAAAPLVAGVVSLILDDPTVPHNKWETVLKGGGAEGLINYSTIGTGSPNLVVNSIYTQGHIDGPWIAYEAGWHTWTATAYGGDKSYSYQWQIKFDGQGSFNSIPGATGTSYSRNVMLGEADFTLRLLVTSAGEQVETELFVDNVICSTTPELCTPGG